MKHVAIEPLGVATHKTPSVHYGEPSSSPYQLSEAMSSAPIASARMIALIRGGLPVGDLENLSEKLEYPVEKLARKVGLSKATWHRRKHEGRLTQDESDKVIRFSRLMTLAMDALGTEQNARGWLGAPQRGLGGEVPLDYAETEVGAREVEDLLGRISHGVYS